MTRNRKKAPVIGGSAELDRRLGKHGRKGTLLTFLRGLSFRGTKLDLGRARDGDRLVGR